MRKSLTFFVLLLLAACSAGTPVLSTLTLPATSTIPMILSSSTPKLVTPSATVSQPARQPGQPELRGFWVDAFNPGIKSPQEIDQLVAFLQAANANAVFVQVRKRGDAYFNRSIEPRSEELKSQPGFDPLATLLEKAHSATPPIAVHAWVVALPVARRSELPVDKSHIYYQHGPDAPEAEQWVSRTNDGSQVAESNYFLDPGNPAAAQYLVDVFVDMVKNYAIDGLHLDYIRYGGGSFGYNPSSLVRYQKMSGKAEIPGPSDPTWQQWRRDQVTDLMRQVYLEATAIRPNLVISAATIAWGAGPTNDAEWKASRTMTDTFQDWLGWMQEGILDLAVPMNYDREKDANQKAWFDRWIGWEKDHRAGRQLAIGLGAYLNDFEGSLAQAQRALVPSTAGNFAQGLSFYAYSQLDIFNTSPEKYARWLTEGDGSAAGLFSQPAPLPDMPWKSKPTAGALKGRMVDVAGRPQDGSLLQLKGPVNRVVRVQGTGFFGALNLPPGEYTLSRDAELFKSFKIETGKVTSLDIKP